MFKTRVTKIQTLQNASTPITTLTTMSLKSDKSQPLSTQFLNNNDLVPNENLMKSEKLNERSMSSLSTSSSIHSLNSMRKRLAKIVKENIKNEFGIGILKIVYNKHIIIKIFWAFVLVGVFAFSAYLITQNFLSYFSYGVRTQRRQIFETPSLYPQINICNQNPITTKYGYSLSLNESFPSGDLSLLPIGQQKLLGHDLNDMLLSCTFNNLPCSSNDFSWYFDRNYGNCYAFNSGLNRTGHTVDLLSSIRAGADYGLQMTLYSNFYENFTQIYSVNGLMVKIANQSFIDLSDGVFLSPGFYTNMAIERFFESLLPKPFSNCDIPNDWSSQGYSDLFNTILNSPYQYSQELCLNLCYVKDIISSCNCNPYDYPVIERVFYFNTLN
jgi:hypothetical protein